MVSSMISKARSMMAWTSSGSRCSDIAVNPETSAKSTVTCLRSPSITLLDVRIFSARCLGVYDSGEANRSPRGPPLSNRPHAWQNLLLGGLLVRQPRHVDSRRAPHSQQNLEPGALSCPQAEHVIA